MGRINVGLPAEVVWPRPPLTPPRALRGSTAPYMYTARRPMALPAITFSLTACSVKPSGAMILHLAALDVGFIDDAAHAAVVVDMAMAVDDGMDRSLAEMLGDQVVGRLGGFRGNQRIEHDPAGFGLHEGDVGQVIAAHLVDAVGDFEQAVQHVQLGIAPQARIDRVRRGLVETDVGLIGLQIPDHIALGTLDGQDVGVAMKPFWAFSKSVRSLNGSVCWTF